MCVNGLHESLDDPPGLPQFQNAKKNVCKSATTLSPSKFAEARSKYIEQLHQIKSLNTGVKIRRIRIRSMMKLLSYRLKKELVCIISTL